MCELSKLSKELALCEDVNEIERMLIAFKLLNNNSEERTELIKKKFKKWEVKAPSFIKELTPEEIYLHGFDSGYKCGENDSQVNTHLNINFKFKDIQ